MGRDEAALAAAAARQAERLRKDGNECYRRSRFGAAIDAYTEAITLCPNVPVYWTNRALCHRKRNDWQKVEEDSRKALQLDHDSVKFCEWKLSLSAFLLCGKWCAGVTCKIVMLCFLLFCLLVWFSFRNSLIWNRKTRYAISLTIIEARIAPDPGYSGKEAWYCIFCKIMQASWLLNLCFP